VTTSTLTVTAFVEARIAEDEERAHQWPEDDKPPPPWAPYRLDAMGHPIWAPRPRVLAQCAAMRKAIDAAWSDHMLIESEWGSCRSQKQLEAIGDEPDVVRALASIWSDHGDFREEWR
jgi:hypothetical protein